MGETKADLSEGLKSFLRPFGGLVRRSESRSAMEHYLAGLLAPLPRKTASDMARALAGTTSQRLQEFLTRTSWDNARMDELRVGRLHEAGHVAGGALVVGEVLIPKRGEHSVGVTRLPVGSAARQQHGQLLVTTHYATDTEHWPVAARLYLPPDWVDDETRRRRALVPEALAYRTLDGIALELIDWRERQGVPVRAVVADAAHSERTELAAGLRARRLPFVVEMTPEQVRHLRVELPGPSAAPRADEPPLLQRVPRDAWLAVPGRSGGAARARRYARARARWVALGQEEGWLLFERQAQGGREQSRLFFAGGLDDRPLAELAWLAEQRTVLPEFTDRARELGLFDYEGRLWNGFHRHVSLVLLARCFQLLSGEDAAAGGPCSAGRAG